MYITGIWETLDKLEKRGKLMKLPQFAEDLRGKVIAITGAAGVLCSMMSEALAAAGAKVAILDRTKEKAQVIAEKI